MADERNHQDEPGYGDLILCVLMSSFSFMMLARFLVMEPKARNIMSTFKSKGNRTEAKVVSLHKWSENEKGTIYNYAAKINFVNSLGRTVEKYMLVDEEFYNTKICKNSSNCFELLSEPGCASNDSKKVTDDSGGDVRLSTTTTLLCDHDDLPEEEEEEEEALVIKTTRREEDQAEATSATVRTGDDEDEDLEEEALIATWEDHKLSWDLETIIEKEATTTTTTLDLVEEGIEIMIYTLPNYPMSASYDTNYRLFDVYKKGKLLLYTIAMITITSMLLPFGIYEAYYYDGSIFVHGFYLLLPFLYVFFGLIFSWYMWKIDFQRRIDWAFHSGKYLLAEEEEVVEEEEW